MFQIGFWELVVVAVVALWVFGPTRLPVVLKIAGRYFLRAKKTYLDIKNEFNEELKKINPLDEQR